MEMTRTQLIVFIAFLLPVSQCALAAEPDPFDIDLTPNPISIETPSRPEKSSLGQGSSPVSAAIQNLNPDISFLGDFLAGNPAALTQRGEVLHRTIYLREVEIDGVGYVSPYAKAFFVASFDEGGVDIEETYMNFFNLPAGLSLKLGKMLIDTDTINPLHQHAIPFVDRPLGLHHILGSDGLKTVGANASIIIPNPWDHYILLSGTAGANLNDTSQYSALNGGNLQSLQYAAHLATSFDLGEKTYLNLNLSYVAAPLPDGSVTATYLGDALFRYVVDPVNNAFTFLNGVITNRGNPFSTGSFSSRGFYNYLGWQFSHRWRIGARYDSVYDLTYGGPETQYTGILSFYPTETNYIRAQFGRHQLSSAIGGPQFLENRAWLQINFTLGPHQIHTAL